MARTTRGSPVGDGVDDGEADLQVGLARTSRCLHFAFCILHFALPLQSLTAHSPGTIGRVRGSRPRRDMKATTARIPTKTRSLMPSNVRPAGRIFHRMPSTGWA